MMPTEKEYQVGSDKKLPVDRETFPLYERKKEITDIPFDPNIRHRLPKMPNHLQYRFMDGIEPIDER